MLIEHSGRKKTCVRAAEQGSLILHSLWACRAEGTARDALDPIHDIFSPTSGAEHASHPGSDFIPIHNKDGRRLLGQVQRGAVQRFQQKAYDLGFRTLKLEKRDKVQADLDQAVNSDYTQHDADCSL
jgi:hypothetical protein